MSISEVLVVQKTSGLPEDTTMFQPLPPFAKIEQELFAAVRDRQTTIRQSSGENPVREYFLHTPPATTKKEKAMHAYIQLGVLRIEPISIVEDRLYRDFSRFSVHFAWKTVKEVLF